MSLIISLVGSSGFTTPSGTIYTWQTITSSSTVATHARLKVDASGGPVVITINDPADIVDAYEFTIKKIDTSSNTVTIRTLLGSFDGDEEIVLENQYDISVFSSDGTNLLVIV